MKNKKGIVWQQIMLAIIAIVVVALVIFWFRKGGEKAYEGQSQTIDELTSDTDGDDVRDFLDKCPNTLEGEDVDIKGCSKRQLEENRR